MEVSRAEGVNKKIVIFSYFSHSGKLKKMSDREPLEYIA
jgi:hypothetical protein